MHIATQLPAVNLEALHTPTSGYCLPSAGVAELAKLRTPFGFRIVLILCWLARAVKNAPLCREVLQQ